MKKTVKKKASAKKKVAVKKAVTKKAVAKKAVTKKKAAVKKAAPKKAVAKKSVAKKAVATKSSAPAALKGTKTAYTKTETLNTIAERTGVARKEVSAVLDSLSDIIAAHVKKGAVGHFSLPGIMKIKTIRKPATKARKGINPFTGEETMFKAKPARTVVKIQPLKKLKDMV